MEVRERILESVRVKPLGKYFFADFDELKERYMAKFGEEFFDANVGDPIDPVPARMLEALKEALDLPSSHTYPPYNGTKEFKEAVREYYQRRFGVKLNNDQIISTLGIKEGIINTFLAVLDPGEYIIMTDPYFPAFPNGALIAQGRIFYLPLREEKEFLPDYSEIPKEVLEKAKVLFLNYPNNPTGKVAPKEFIAETVRFARKHELVLIWDHAYAEIYYTQEPPHSPLEFAKSSDWIIEFSSVSKSFNAPGWRVGWGVGNEEIIRALSKVKNNVDSGVFKALQHATAVGLRECMEEVRRQREIYKERKDIALKYLREANAQAIEPEATIFLLFKVPQKFLKEDDPSLAAAKWLLEKGISLSPGSGYGEQTKNFLRISLTVPTDKFERGMRKLRDVLLKERIPEWKA